jgi:hypothetical protein
MILRGRLRLTYWRNTAVPDVRGHALGDSRSLVDPDRRRSTESEKYDCLRGVSSAERIKKKLDPFNDVVDITAGTALALPRNTFTNLYAN